MCLPEGTCQVLTWRGSGKHQLPLHSPSISQARQWQEGMQRLLPPWGWRNRNTEGEGASPAAVTTRETWQQPWRTLIHFPVLKSGFINIIAQSNPFFNDEFRLIYSTCFCQKGKVTPVFCKAPRAMWGDPVLNNLMESAQICQLHP